MVHTLKFLIGSITLASTLIGQPVLAAAPLDCNAVLTPREVSLQYDRITYRGNRLNRKKLAEWVAAHSEEFQRGAQLAADHIQWISLAEFQEKLYVNFRDYLKSRAPGERLVLVNAFEAEYYGRPDDPKSWKSNGWIADYLTRAFPEAKLQVVNVQDVAQFLTHETAAGRDVRGIRWIFADDAVYSGHQTSSLASDLSATLLQNPAIANAGRKPAIDVVAPYSTSLARRVFAADGTATLVSKNNMPLMTEIDPEGIIPRKLVSEVTLTFFQHKLPDYKSFSEYLASGYLLEPGRSRQVPFIDREASPYTDRRHYNNPYQRPADSANQRPRY